MRSIGIVSVAGLVAATYGAIEAPVHIFQRSSTSTEKSGNLLSISPKDARLFLAQRLGLSSYHNLQGAGDDTVRLLNGYGHTQIPLFGSNEDHTSYRRLLVVIEGLDQPQEILADIGKPAFSISSPPSSSSNLQLAVDLLNQDRHRRGATENCKSRQIKGLSQETIQGGFSSNDPIGTCTVHTLSTDSPYSKMSPLEKLAMLSASTTQAMKNVYQNPLPPSYLDGSTAIFHVSTLETIARREGISSKEYHQALTTLKEILSSIAKTKDQESTIVLMPLVTRVAKRDVAAYGSYEVPSILENRQAAAETPLAASTSATVSKPSLKPSQTTIVKAAMPSCYRSEAVCNSNTLNCTGHGACRKKYVEKSGDEVVAECWSCLCAASVFTNDRGQNKSTYWGGPACQKKDVSVPFFLFAGFAIFMAAALSWGVGLLYSIGQEDLPSVLGAGVAPTMRK